MSTDTKTTRKPGRPPVTIVWPNGGFTVEQLQLSTGLSKVTLYQKVNEALENKTLEESGKESTKQGRPRIVFKKSDGSSTATVTNGVAAVASPVTLTAAVS